MKLQPVTPRHSGHDSDPGWCKFKFQTLPSKLALNNNSHGHGHCTYIYMYVHVWVYILHVDIYNVHWLTLPSNQSFYRLIVGFGMGVADCEVGQ